MNYDECKATEPQWDDAPEYVPCAMAGCPMVVRALGVDELCEMCKATEERAKRMKLPMQALMVSHCDTPGWPKRIRRAL